MDTTLVVMAAGMGSRFGGLKQAEPITPDGKCILDFSVFDAKAAGFNKVVFIIRKDMEKDFKKLVGDRISKTIHVDYVYQTTDELPEGRTKPFGTAHAIMCCEGVVNTPFVVINADDYYGHNAFYEIHDHLLTAKPGEYAMVAYQLEKTLSKNGTVSRGVCVMKDGFMQSLDEVAKITSDGSYEKNGTVIKAPGDTPVSMNMWGLTLDIFDILREKYKYFLENANLLKDEFFIPLVVSECVAEKKATVKVYNNADRWYGITYREDLPEVKEAIAGYIAEGLYEGL